MLPIKISGNVRLWYSIEVVAQNLDADNEEGRQVAKKYLLQISEHHDASVDA